MRRHWIHAALALALGGRLAGSAWAEPPVAAAPPAAPQEELVEGAVLQPALEVEPEVDGQPFPMRFPGPERPQPKGYVIFWGGAYLIQPTFQSDPAFLRTQGNAVQQVDFTHHVSYAPTAGLGFTTKEGWGVRSQWFAFQQNSDASGTSAPDAAISAISPLSLGSANRAGNLQANSDFNLMAWDAEGTCTWNVSRCCLLVGSGVRYAHVSQDYAAFISSPDGSQTAVRSGHNFNGAGPTFSVDGRLPLREGRLALYSKARFSVLFGEEREDYSAASTGVAALNSAQSEVHVLPVGELEVGAEYSKLLGRHQRARFFLQSGFVGQIWWGGGNASNVDPLAGTTANGTNFGFVGVALRAGLTF
jgi:hypothetical protein